MAGTIQGGVAPAGKVSPAGADTTHHLAGIALTLTSIFLFAGSNALAKVVEQGVPVGELLFIRGLLATLLIGWLVRWNDIRDLLQGGQLGLHALRIGTSAVEVFCYYWAITSLPLANASTIYLAGPIYVTAMSAIFLREHVGLRQAAAVLIGFAGVVVAVQPQSQSLDMHAIVAVIGSFLYAISLVATRGLRRTPNSLLVASQMLALSVVSLTTIPAGWVVPTKLEVMQMGAVGLVTVVAYACVNRGLQLAPASVVAPFNYASIIGAAVLGYLVFADVPSVPTLVGAGIVVAAGLLVLAPDRGRRGRVD